MEWSTALIHATHWIHLSKTYKWKKTLKTAFCIIFFTRLFKGKTIGIENRRVVSRVSGWGMITYKGVWSDGVIVEAGADGCSVIVLLIPFNTVKQTFLPFPHSPSCNKKHTHKAKDTVLKKASLVKEIFFF